MIQSTAEDTKQSEKIGGDSTKAVVTRASVSDANADLANIYKDHFQKKSKHNRCLKITLFIIVSVIAIAVIVITGIVSINITRNHNLYDSEVLIALMSSLFSGFSSVIGLMLIITKYLFPNNEDDKLIEYMIQMQSVAQNTNQ